MRPVPPDLATITKRRRIAVIHAYLHSPYPYSVSFSGKRLKIKVVPRHAKFKQCRTGIFLKHIKNFITDERTLLMFDS